MPDGPSWIKHSPFAVDKARTSGCLLGMRSASDECAAFVQMTTGKERHSRVEIRVMPYTCLIHVLYVRYANRASQYRCLIHVLYMSYTPTREIENSRFLTKHNSDSDATAAMQAPWGVLPAHGGPHRVKNSAWP